MDQEKIDALYNYCQERCLWQFFSRSWDREENIDNVLRITGEILTGIAPARETPMERLHYADAKVLAGDFVRLFPWIEEMGPAQVRELLSGVKDRLTEITVTKSMNGELHHSLY